MGEIGENVCPNFLQPFLKNIGKMSCNNGSRELIQLFHSPHRKGWPSPSAVAYLIHKCDDMVFSSPRGQSHYKWIDWFLYRRIPGNAFYRSDNTLKLCLFYACVCIALNAFRRHFVNVNLADGQVLKYAINLQITSLKIDGLECFSGPVQRTS